MNEPVVSLSLHASKASNIQWLLGKRITVVYLRMIERHGMD